MFVASFAHLIIVIGVVLLLVVLCVPPLLHFAIDIYMSWYYNDEIEKNRLLYKLPKVAKAYLLYGVQLSI